MPEIGLSIIMPSLNVGQYIRECLESAVSQTLKCIEILCVDAGSTDGTLEIIMEYARKDNRIRIVNSDQKSYGYQVNLGIYMARGKYIAILETDDFVDSNMYAELCSIADAHNVDYVKADFDSFSVLSNGQKYYERVKLFQDTDRWYNRVFTPRECERLFCTDYFLWKGIYKRDFLISNEVKLNETPGAAFQDMAFMLQVLSYAKRAIYSDKSLYRYRIDRNEASTYSPKILGYGHQEFEFALSLISSGKPIFEKGLYIHMLHSFRGELYPVLQRLNCDFDSEYVKPHYEWFMKHINSSLEKGIIDLNLDSYGFDGVSDAMKRTLSGKKAIIEDVKAIIDDVDRTNCRKEELIKTCHDRQAVIFGAGKRGSYYLRSIDGMINVVAFVDNSEDKQGNKVYGYDVYSLEECQRRFPKCYYIIANRGNSVGILDQLLLKGIERERILVNPLSD